MDTLTGNTLTKKQADQLRRASRATAKQRRRGKVGRNEPCPCGSGLKFKKCHLDMARKMGAA